MIARFFKALGLAAWGVALAAPALAFDPMTFVPKHPDETYLSVDELLMVEAGNLTLDDFRWIARPLVIFADSPEDPRFKQQMEYVSDDWISLAERDVAVIIDTDPAAKSPIRQALRPRGFDLVLIGKDGYIYLRKPLPWKVREISRSIDKMPLRIEELREMRSGKADGNG